MKRKTKIAVGGALLLLGTTILTGCTASFCSVTDKANILYLLDPGVTTYYSEEQEDGTCEKLYLFGEETNFYCTYSINENGYLAKVDTQAASSSYRTPSIFYWKEFDKQLLETIVYEVSEAENDEAAFDWFETNITELGQLKFYGDSNEYSEDTMGLLDKYGYLKFEDSVNEKKVLWTNFDVLDQQVRASNEVSIDECPTTNYLALYKKQMNSYISSYRSCLAINDGLYGAYGVDGLPAQISGKKWTDWKGLLEFILVWPIGAFIDVLTTGLLKAGLANGVAQIISIFIATIIIRGIMLLATFKQTQSNQKMQELQPEIQKIQAKYPNSNTNMYEKQRMAEETQKLYKKHKINPLSSILVMIVQFPVFICVWGAMQGSALLASGQFLGLRLSDSISSVLFSASAWKTGAGATALVLFLLMAGAQVVSMLLPQWIQKKNTKKLARLGKNPAQKQQNSTMKIFTYVMLAMVIFMGFSLASGMGVYWFVGALVSIAQTLINQAITKKNAKKGKNK